MRYCFALLSLLAAVCSATAAPLDSLYTTPAGTRIRAYFEAFNSGSDSAMRAFYTANFTDSALAQRGIDDRLTTYHRIRSSIPRMEPQRLISEAGNVTVVAVQSGDAQLELSIRHQAAPPFKIANIGIERRMPPSANGRIVLTPLPEAAALDSIDTLLNRLALADSFSGAVLIARQGTPILRKAWGMADREHRVPNTPDTKFNFGSIGKSFTRIAIEKLIAEGKLAPSDNLGKYLPDYPNSDAKRKVTIQQLLDMRSGIGDFFGEEFLNTPRDRIRGLKDYLPMFAAKPLLFEPGSQERYSNGGFVVLGLIIEKLTGKSYYDHISEVVFAPAGMKNSGWFESDAIVPDRAIGYTHRWQPVDKDSPELRSNLLTMPGIGSSAGGGYSTVDDLLAFVSALESGKLRSSEGGGMGIAGGAPGLNAAVESGLPGGYTIIVLSNFDPPSAETTAAMLRGWLIRAKR